MMKCSLLLMLFVFACGHSFAQYVPEGDTLRRVADSVSGFNGVRTGYVNSVKVIAEWKNGMLDGAYTSYYSNGIIRAKGHYTANRRTGKWIVYSQSGKDFLIIFFNKFGTTSLRRVSSEGLSHVRFGKGEIYYHQPSMIIAGDTIVGKVKVRRGLKHGELEERYSSGSLYSIAEYKNGLFYGLRRLYFPATKPAAEMEYNDAGPTGMWKFYDENGGLISMRDFNGQTDYSSQRLYIGDYDVLWAQRCLIYVDCTFVSPSSISAASDTSLYGFANNLLKNADIIAYADPMLSKEYNLTHDNSELLPSIINGKASTPRGWLLMVDFFYNIQTTLMYHSVISLCPIAIESDAGTTYCGPWLYYPELRDIAGRANNRQIINLLKMLKSGNFQYLVMAQQSRYGIIPVRDILLHGLENNYRLPEEEHDLWLQSYGVNNPVYR